MGITVEVLPSTPEVIAGRKAINEKVEAMTNAQLQWHQDTSPQAYREKRRNGTGGFPKPMLLGEADVISIPSTFGAPDITLRRIKPTTGDVKGVMLHFHAGGLVYGSADGQDPYLAEFANDLSLAVVSVEYRLAPENPFPAPAEDALDAIRFAMSPEGDAQLGGSLLFIGGESSGAYLTAWSVLKLRDEGLDVQGRIVGLILNYGVFDLSSTPSYDIYKGRAIVNGADLRLLTSAAFPSSKFSEQQRQSSSLSPLYADLKGLPPAFFLVGTADPALDDSVFLASRWSLAGNETQLNIVPEGIHAFTLLPFGDAGAEGKVLIKGFIKKRLAA